MNFDTRGPGETENRKMELEKRKQALLRELAGIERELQSLGVGAQQGGEIVETKKGMETKEAAKLIPGFTWENEAKGTQTKIEYTSDGKEGLRWKVWPDPDGAGDMFLQVEIPKGADLREAYSAGLVSGAFEWDGKGYARDVRGSIEPALFKIPQRDVKKIPDLTNNCSDVGAGAVVIDSKLLVKKGKVQF